MMHFPARTLVRFFANHHLLSASGQPQWYTVTGGAQEYVAPPDRAASPTASAPIAARRKSPATGRHGVQIRDTQGGVETYDRVVMACHGDEALALLKDADAARTRGAVGLPLPEEPRRAAPRSQRDAQAAALLGQLGLYLGRRSDASQIVGELLDEPAAGHRQALPPVRQPQSRARHRARTGFRPAPNSTIPCSITPPSPPRAGSRPCKGARNTWFCGAHLRHGFHEDGLGQRRRGGPPDGRRRPLGQTRRNLRCGAAEISAAGAFRDARLPLHPEPAS